MLFGMVKAIEIIFYQTHILSWPEEDFAKALRQLCDEDLEKISFTLLYLGIFSDYIYKENSNGNL
jgi:hypothetical protein